MGTPDLLYLLFVILTLAYTVIDSFIKSQKTKKTFLVLVYIPAALLYILFTVNYLMQAKIYETKLDNAIEKAIKQEHNITSVTNMSKEQSTKTESLIQMAKVQGDRLINISDMAKNQELNFREFIKKEMIIREISVKVRYIVHTKTKANQIVPYNFKSIAFIVNKNNSATDIVKGITDNDIKLVSPVEIKYPSENTIEITFDYEPSNHKDIIGKPIAFLSNYFGIRLYFNKNRFLINEDIEDNMLIEAYMYINNRLYHKHEIEFPTKYNTHIYYKRDGMFSNIEEKYLGMIGLQDNTLYKNIISKN